mmetsp:Transcript_29838/g.82201  ORF Transcript_29838/g.82201 Transcript_29838/m.82201 type:complete len:222 (+) Transcript_29838:1010-1675(+)
MGSSSSPKPARFFSWRSRSLRASKSSAARPRLNSRAFKAAAMASSAERRATAAVRVRLSLSSRFPKRTRFAASSPRGLARGASAPPAPSGEARSTFFNVASVASLIFSKSSAELTPERPASSTITARSRRPTPATVMPAHSRCSCRASSVHCATPLTASPRSRSCRAASRSCTAPCRVSSRSARKARCLGRLCNSLHSSAPRIVLWAHMATWSAASLAVMA